MSSNSSHVRRQLGPALATLRKQTEGVALIEEFQSRGENVTEDTLRGKQYFIKLNLKIEALEKTIDRVSNLMQEWNEVIAADNSGDKFEQKVFAEFDTAKKPSETLELAREEVTNAKEKLQLSKLFVNETASENGEEQQYSRQIIAPKIQLPKLSHPRFDGQISNWKRFEEYFESTIHNNSTLTNTEKVTYLLSLLDGEAKQATAGFMLTGDNYEIVRKLLKTRFGDNKLIANQLIYQLNELKLTNKNLGAVKIFVNSAYEKYQQINQIGRDIGGDQFMAMVERQLPRYVLEKLFDRKRWNPLWNIEIMMSELYDIIREFEILNTKKGEDGKEKPIQARVAAVHQPNDRDKRGCLFCNGNHKSYRCERYRTTTQKRNRLVEIKRCVRCLQSYTPNHCNKTCANCGRNHHRIICPTNETSSQNATRQDSQRGNTRRNQTNTTSRPTNSNPNFTPLPNTCTMIAADGQQHRNEPEETMTLSTSTNDRKNIKTSLPTIFVNIANPKDANRNIKLLALLDSGSERSYITEDVAKQLHLQPLSQTTLTTETFGGHYTSNNVTTVMVNLNKENCIKLITVPEIIGPTDINYINKYNEVVTTKLIPKLLIGMDYLLELLGLKGQMIKDNIEKFETNIGEILLNKCTDKDKVTKIMTIRSKFDNEIEKEIIPINKNDDKFNMIEKFWRLEELGITETPHKFIDEEIKENFEKDIQFENGRYYVSWLFNGREKQLESNIGIAYYRLKTIQNRLTQNVDLLDKVKTLFKEQADEGIIEKVEQSTTYDHPISYLPFQLVIKPDKATTKIRCVYDASAHKKDALSINDTMHQGPLLLPQLVGVLLRFRHGKFVAISDIRSAFLQIGLKEPSRDVVRFLLPKDWMAPVDNQNIQVWRFTRVCFGVNCSPSILALTLQHHLKKYHYQADEIITNLYVDNVTEINDDEHQLLMECKKTNKIFEEGGFELREYYSNASSIRQHFNPITSSETKFMGHKWNFQEDTITLTWVSWRYATKLTKRNIIGYIGTIYDPLGLLSPSVLPLKLCVRKIWETQPQPNWDDELADELIQRWYNIVTEEKHQMTIPRYASDKTDKTSLAIFGDASEQAFGVAAYIINKGKANICMGKARLFPMDKTKGQHLTIPRKELIALLAATRLAKYIVTELKNTVTDVTIFSDSTIALQQLNHADDNSIFVRNRVTEIQKIRSNFTFRYIQTGDNPADIASRGIPINKLQENKLWWNGPTFLTEEKSSWPQKIVIHPNAKNNDGNQYTAATMIATSANEKLQLPQTSWKQLLKLFVNMITFIHKCNRMQQIPATEAGATLLLVRLEQKKYPPTSKLIERLKLFWDDEHKVWRVRTRLQREDWNYDTCNPLWISNSSNILYRIIEHHHEVTHQNASTTTLRIRQNIWVSYRTVKSTIKQCLHCKIHNIKPYRQEIFAPLPTSRIENGKVFGNIGLDIAGPIHTREGKKYYLLITCLKTRGIHLELLDDQTTEEVITVLKRYMARKGTPTYMISDNATYFKLAKSHIKNEHPSINWHMINPRTPHEGGIYERLNRDIKESLKRSIRKRILTRKELELLLISIESVLNQRPIIALCDDPDNHEILRPCDFMQPGSNQNELQLNEPISEYDKNDPDFIVKQTTGSQLRKMHETQQNNLNTFWSIWSEKYIKMLRDHVKPTADNNNNQSPKLGELVLLGEKDNKNRAQWKMGRIIKLLKGRDDVIRTCEVILPNRKTTIRSILHLYPLEVGGTLSGNEIEIKYKTKGIELQKTSPPQKRRMRNVNSNQNYSEDNDQDAPVNNSTQTNKLLTTSSVITVIMIIAISMINGTAAQKPMICHKNSAPLIWKMPTIMKCHLNKITQKEIPRMATVALYKRNNVQYVSEGTYCKLESSTIRQQTHLNGNPEITETKNPDEYLSEEECRRMITKRTCQHGILRKHHNTYKTENSVKIDPPNRIASFVSGTRDEIKRNCILIPIKIFAHHGSTKAVSTMGDLSECNYEDEKCKPSKNELFIWYRNETQKCAFVKVYKGEAMITSTTIIIESLHAMLTRETDGSFVTDCGKKLMETHQGLAFQIFTLNRKTRETSLDTAKAKRVKRYMDVSDEETADLQYLEHNTFETIRKLTTTICMIINNHQSYLEEMMKSNPTTLMRKLLSKENIRARTINYETVEITICHALEKDEYEFISNEINCTIPLKVKNRILYLKTDDYTLHYDPRKATEEFCDDHIIISIENQLLNLNRKTGITTLIKPIKHEINQTDEDWTFLKEQIFKDVLFHSSNTITEEVMEEWEKNAESKTEIAIEDQTVYAHEEIKDLWEFHPIVRIGKQVWIIWVSIICALSTYGAITVLTKHFKGTMKHTKKTRESIALLQVPAGKEVSKNDEQDNVVELEQENASKVTFQRSPTRKSLTHSIMIAKGRGRRSVAKAMK